MKRFLVFLSLSLFLFSTLNATSKEKSGTGISPTLLQEIEGSFRMERTDRLVSNILAEMEDGKVTVDREKLLSLDPYFSFKLERHAITNQQSTGRCWMFAGLNILRDRAAKTLGMKDIEFSQSYLFFYDKLEKANLFLEGVIKYRTKPLEDRYVEFLFREPVGDGGQWVGVAELVKKYGLVPGDVMPDTFNASHSRGIGRAINLKLKEYALKIRNPKTSAADLPKIKSAALKDVYKILVLNLGMPPKSFQWRYEDKDGKLTVSKKYTPLEFAKEAIGDTLDDYYVFYSIPTRPFGKLYTIDMDKAVADRPSMVFLNLPIETLKEMAAKSVKDKEPVWFGADVGQDGLGDKGLWMPEAHNLESLYGMPFKLSRKELFETNSTLPTHAMVFVGLDEQNGKIGKWLVENSWGTKAGKDGYYTITDDWFDLFIQAVVINKKYVSPEVLKLFSTEPTVIPPWDPMYKSFTNN